MLRRALVASTIAAVSALPLADFASATKPSKGDQTCTSRGANKGGTCNTTGGGNGGGGAGGGRGGGGGGGGGNTGNTEDACDNQVDGTIVIVGGSAFQCNNYDVDVRVF